MAEIKMLNYIIPLALLTLNKDLMHICREIILVVIFSLILSYIVALTWNFVSSCFERVGLGRCERIGAAVVALFLCSCVYLLVYRFIPLLRAQAKEVWDMILEEQTRQDFSVIISKHFGVEIGIVNDFLERIFFEFRSYAENVKGIASVIAVTTGSVISNIIHMLLVIVMSLHIIKEWGGWKERVLNFAKIINLSLSGQKKLVDFMEYFHTGFKGWLAGQLLTSIILSGYYFSCFYFLKLRGSVLLSLICGFTVFIPYLGDFIVSIAVGISLLISTGVTAEKVVLIFSWIILGHCIGSYALTPVLVKRHTGVPPVQIIIGIIVFKNLFGIIGVMINVPLLLVLNGLPLLFASESNVTSHARKDHD